MCRLCREDYPISPEISQDLKDLVHRLQEKYKVFRVILYGSFARGDFFDTSDIDLIVVGDFNERFVERIRIVLDLWTGKRNLEPLVYSQTELQNMLREERPFIKIALEEGMDLI